MRWVMDDNIEEMRAFPDIFEPTTVSTLAKSSGRALNGIADLLDRRRDGGFVRHYHGDLHLQNICLLDDRPTLFDCIEFNGDIACIDTLYDLAFLLMDLDHRGQQDQANLVLNRYLARTGDTNALPTLRFFLSFRAAVKAKVEGSSEFAYEIMTPLTADGHIDADGWRANADKCTVRRFWRHEDDENGLLVQTELGWIFDYDPDEEDDDKPLFQLDDHLFKRD